MVRIATLIFAFIAPLLPTPDLGAEQTTPVEAPLEQQLAELNSAVRDIVALLERQVEGHETNLLIKRIELSSQSLIAKKERLRRLRGEAANLKEKGGSLANTLEASEQQLAEAVEDDELQQFHLEQLRQRLKSVADRQRELDRELIVLENEVRTGEENMEILEAVLDERLDLR